MSAKGGGDVRKRQAKRYIFVKPTGNIPPPKKNTSTLSENFRKSQRGVSEFSGHIRKKCVFNAFSNFNIFSNKEKLYLRCMVCYHRSAEKVSDNFKSNLTALCVYTRR